MKITTTRLFGLPEITPEEVYHLLGRPNFHTFDNNSTRSYMKHHLPGAIHLDPGDYSAGDLPNDKQATLVFYCSDPLCGAGPYAAKRARNMGFEQVFVMPCGITGWLKKGFPVEQEIKNGAA